LGILVIFVDRVVRRRLDHKRTLREILQAKNRFTAKRRSWHCWGWFPTLQSTFKEVQVHFKRVWNQ